SGTVFTEATDFELFSARTLRFGRFYNSRATELPGDASQLGPGWRHDFDEVLLADEDTTGVRTLALRDREGRFIGFDLPLVDGESDFNAAERLTLTRVDGRTYEIRDLTDRVRVFRFGGGDGPTPPTYQPPAGKQARLDAVRWLDGEARFYWEKGRLTGFTDPAGRQVVVQPDPQGRIAALRLVRAQGRDCDIHLATYRYDGDGRLIAHIDRNRNPRWYRYDARGRLIRETDRNGYSFHFHYDELDRCTHTYGDDNAYWCAFAYDGSVTRVTDGFGGVTRYGYDENSRVTSIIDALGGVKTIAYTPEGWKAAETDAAGGTTETAYDARGRVVARTAPDGAKTSWAYADDGGVVQTDALGNPWRLERTAGRVAAAVTPLGHRARFERDAAGRVTAVVDASGAVWQRTWTPDGLVAQDARPDGVRVRYTYDALGHVTAVEELNPAGETRTRKLERDAEGRITALDGPAGHRERYTLLPEGQPVVLASGGRKATRTYGGWGRLHSHTDPLGRTTKVDWDAHHNVLAIHQPGGRTWRYLRDRLGRVTTLRTPDGLRVGYTYDPAGRILEEIRDDRTIKRQYDAAGRVTKVQWGHGSETRLRYDAVGRLVRVEGRGLAGEDDRPVDRTYDADGRLATEVQGDGVLRWRYDALGRPTRRTTSWGTREHLRWGDAGLQALVDPLGGEHGFDHDAWGRRDTWRQPGGGEQRLTFDALDRLVGDALAVPGGAIAVDRRLVWSEDDTVTEADVRTAEGRRRQQLRYDATGRLIAQAVNDGAPTAFRHDDADNLVADGETTREFVGDRLVADSAGHRFRHDRGGRLVARQGPEGTQRLWFDDRDRLVRVHTADDRVVHHRYDALGRRVETLAEQPDGGVTAEAFHWDADHLARRVVTRPATGELLRDEHYTYDPERAHVPLFRVVRGGDDPTPRTQFYSTDQRGAVTRLSDADGRALWAATYDPYGRLQHLEADDAELAHQPLRLLGQLHDEATDLGHHRFRVYDPQAARFISPDPLGIQGGPNAYGYPTDPVAWADPLGLIACNLSWNQFQHETAGMFSSRQDAAAAWRATRTAPAGWEYHGTQNGLHHFSGSDKPPLNGAPASSVYSHDRGGVVGQNAIYDGNGAVVGHVDFKNHGIPSGHYHTFPPGQPWVGHGAGAPHYHHSTVPAGWSQIPPGSSPQVPIGT
ncbi:MAG: RHS repeat-associated core domain-containing protein, partial [bacterium]